MEKVKKIFSANLPWKILSIILGFLFWLIGMNINNPVMTEVVKVELQLLNTSYIESANLTLLNYDEIDNTNINVNIKGTRDEIDNLRNDKEAITAYIDFKPANVTNADNVGKDIELMVNVTNNNENITILNLSPKNVSLQFDKVVTEEKEVVIDLIGKDKNRYVLEDDPILSPNTISVKGPETIVNTIDKIVGTINVEKSTQTFTETVEVKAVDVNGKVVSKNIQLATNVVAVTVDVSQGSTVSIIEPTVVGETNRNIEIVSVNYEPKFVKVIGDESDIQSLRNITLEPIDITEIEETTEYTFDVRPILNRYNLQIEEGTPYEIVVEVEVRYLDIVTYRYYVEDILIQGMKENITGPSYIDVSFVGDKEVISSLTKDDIKLNLDLRNIEEGINTLTINSSLPEGVSFLDDSPPVVEFYYRVDSDELESETVPTLNVDTDINTNSDEQQDSNESIEE